MRRLCSLLGLVATAAACGEPFGIVGGTGGASTSGATGGHGSSSSASTGGAGAAPTCEPGVAGSCPAGEYCAGDTLACTKCKDLSRLHFAEPAPIPLSPDTAGTSALYPRIGGADVLYFARRYKMGTLPVRQIAAAPPNAKHDGWGAWSELGDPINTAWDESAPLWLPDGKILEGIVDTSKVDLQKPTLLFDSNRDGITAYKLFAANVGGAEAAELALPSGKRDTDVAAAPSANPPRFYWVSDTGTVLGPRLVTATPTMSATAVDITFDNGCAVGNVGAPWVTEDGKHLFFAAQYPGGAACAPGIGAPIRVFFTRMDPEGKQVAGDQAQPLFPSDMKSYDTTPSLTPDLCAVVFSRFDESANGRITRALRD